MTGLALALAVFAAAWIAAGLAGILFVLGAGKLARDADDIMAVADATRECTSCLGDWGPCTCTEPCPSIRCTAWAGASAPPPLRPIRDTEKDM